MTAEAVLTMFQRIWVSLELLGLPMALMGGLSVAVWKHPRATRDVDLLIDPGALAIDALVARLAKEGFRHRRDPPILHVGSSRFLQLIHEARGTFLDIQVDLLLAESEYQRRALNRRIQAKIPGLDLAIFVLSCEDLIIHKLIAGRLLDLADTVTLLRVNRSTLDFPYMTKWLSHFSLAPDWNRVWCEAFPEESPPSD